MDRILKFRAWNRLEKYMCNVYVLDDTKKAATEINAHFSKGYNDSGNKSFYLHDVELMQFTGLHDKNGKEIYDGDVLKYLYTKVVFWGTHSIEAIWNGQETTFTFTGWLIKYEDGRIDLLDANEPNEIIGNIYENPELIK